MLSEGGTKNEEDSEEKIETYKVSLIYDFEIEVDEDEDPEELAIELLAEGGWSGVGNPDRTRVKKVK